MRAAAFIGTVVASLLPVLAIVVLYSVHGMSARLGLVAAFTAAFSTSLWFMTDGKIIEVFAATSTWVALVKGLRSCNWLTASRFSAVCVVFIGTNTNNGS
ncbi:hypothetical protein BK809_0000999 [Diplodia seriata]|uniref:DUF6594 domain-containing protein n=1 Tax=Diplodia seriata TaxID=420778 RepID=A0A1S8B5N0_9PEZI|nr:hypothetical protein BK809_0000999 [Diplodia seriata]